ncbi:unnamed protein product [Prorocentrum cordatum]|uniref:NAD(P)-binding domain-containing protein n=1 Tax=Prorocentrum cordatum TaxID=2364126 RepID=A0ABN9QYV5_9DINO|nr:unnamed protein product [Polarella glacialis]
MYKVLREAKVDVRALVHSADKAKTALGCKRCDESEGIYLGDVTKKDTIQGAFNGVDTVMIAVGAHGDEPDDVVDKIEWYCVKNRVDTLLVAGKDGKRIVLFSSMSTSKPHKHVLEDKARAEKYIIEQGVPYTIVKPCGLSEDDAGDRDLLIGHDDVADANDWFKTCFHKVPRAHVVSVASAALLSLPAGQMRFDICAKLAGSGPADVKAASRGRAPSGPREAHGLQEDPMRANALKLVLTGPRRTCSAQWYSPGLGEIQDRTAYPEAPRFK